MQIQSINTFNKFKTNSFKASGVPSSSVKNTGKNLSKKVEMVIPNGLNKYEKLYYELNQIYPKSVTERWFAKGEKSKKISSKDLVVVIEENKVPTEIKFQEPLLKDIFHKNIPTDDFIVADALTLVGITYVLDDFSKNKKEKDKSNNQEKIIFT